MKSLILSLSFLAFSFIAIAQIPAGTKLLGGNMGYSSQNNNNGFVENTYRSLFISPRFGWAVKENVVNGIEVSYMNNKNSSPNQTASTSHSIGLSFFKQKYFPLIQSFMVFGEGIVGASYGWRSDYQKGYAVNAGLGGGIAYKAGNKFLFTVSAPNALNAGISYSKTSLNTPNTIQEQTSFNAAIGTNISLQNMQFGVVLLF